jgi:hypothetical protein
MRRMRIVCDIFTTTGGSAASRHRARRMRAA